MFKHLLSLALLILMAAPCAAQTSTPPPVNPVAFCGTQASPSATSHQLSFDGAAAEAVTMTTPASPASPLKTFCDANTPGWTHAFTLAANRFTVGTHTVRVSSINQFGTTLGPSFTVLVGVAPGQFTIGGAGQLP